MIEAWAVVEHGIVAESRDADRTVPWWSFTKTVLAAAALALVRDGRLALDTRLPGRPFTLRQLLQHRAGLAEYGRLPAYREAVARGDEPWPVADLLARTGAETLRYAPGEGWDYSNIGYLFVRQAIEGATGETIGRALGRLVLSPLGIASARLAARPDDLVGVSMGEAAGYHPAWVYHGLLVGTVRDAALLLDRLMSREGPWTELAATMLERHALEGPVAGRPWVRPGYGLGLITGEATSGLTVAGHTGGGPGSTIAVYRRLGGPDSGRVAACFTTAIDAAAPERKVFDLLGG